MVEQLLYPPDFFSLVDFAHKELFLPKEHVWFALKNIRNYLDSMTLGDIRSTVPRGTFLANPELISIGENTHIEPGAFIAGPCVIGNHCEIRHGAYIRGDVVIGNNCVVGHATEVKNSIFLNGAKAAHFAYVGDTILGSCNVGAGVKFANLKLNKKEVLVSSGGVRVATGLHKFGAIVGDGVQLGCNIVVNPGTLIGPFAVCFPGVIVGGTIPHGKTVKPGNQAIIL